MAELAWSWMTDSNVSVPLESDRCVKVSANSCVVLALSTVTYSPKIIFRFPN